MPHEVSPFEDARFVSFFSSLRAPVAKSAAKKIVELAGIKDGESVLDLGCGPGLIAKHIASLRELGDLLLLDRSKEMAKLARKNLRGLTVKHTVKVFDLEKEGVRRLASKKFDHVLAIDVWHLLESRNFIRSLFDSLLAPKGTFTLALHKEVSESAMKAFHKTRWEIRDEITKQLSKRYPRFHFPNSSRGPFAHGSEIAKFKKELKEIGLVLVGEEEDDSLADVNELAKFPPDSFKIEVLRLLPRIPSKLLDKTIRSSVDLVLKKKNIKLEPIATELISVFQKS